MNNLPPSLQQLNRTFIGSVLFIDIVGYSRRTVPDQLEIKEVFNNLLTEAVSNVAPSERIMVDTGDGAGVAFLGDPEDALFTALSLRDFIDTGKVKVGEPGFVRMGINLGPLKMVRDINGHTNMIGDGVNDAQRVMSFSEPGQVMVSHSYFDIISRFSRDYTKLFVYEGTRHDKHVREHEVYRFGPAKGAEQLGEQLTEKMRDRSRARQPASADLAGPNHGSAPDPAWSGAAAATAASGQHAAQTVQPSKKRAWRNAMIATTMGAIALTGAVWSWSTKPAADQFEPPVLATSAPGPSAAAPQAGQQAPATMENAADKSAEKRMEKAVEKEADQAAGRAAGNITEKPAALSAPKSADNAAADNATDKAADKVANNAAEKETDKAAEKADKKDEAPARQPGTVKLAVQPWGEIYIDGSKRGVSPPLKSLSLPPGKHRVEIRNGQLAPHRQTIDVKSNAETTIQYVF